MLEKMPYKGCEIEFRGKRKVWHMNKEVFGA